MELPFVSELKISQNAHSGMKNSSPSTAPAFDSSAVSNPVLRALDDAGLTCPEDCVLAGGRASAPDELPFTLVTRSKRKRVPSPQKGDEAVSAEPPLHFALQAGNGEESTSKPETEAWQWKDPFGASIVPPGVDPVTLARVPCARTKQTVRQATGTGKRRSALSARAGASPASGSSGSASDRSRARIFVKGCAEDSQRAAGGDQQPALRCAAFA